MAERAALITGASGGIGLAIARALAEEGYGLTLSARRPQKLEEAVQPLRDDGVDVITVPANMTSEEEIAAIFRAHEEHFGRLDVLVNNAGVGIGAPLEEIQTKFVDMQLAVNLRALIVGTREGLPSLKKAGAEHGKALIVNTASLGGKGGPAWLSVYGATKAAVISFTESTRREVAREGIQCTALAPGFVDTAMADFIRDEIGEDLIPPSDIAEGVRFLLRTSRNCNVPEIVFVRPGEDFVGAGRGSTESPRRRLRRPRPRLPGDRPGTGAGAPRPRGDGRDLGGAPSRRRGGRPRLRRGRGIPHLPAP